MDPLSVKAVAPALDTIVEIPTPENVAFRYALAGPFCRVTAFLIDALVRIVMIAALALLMTLFGLVGAEFLGMSSVLPLMMFVWFGLEWFYGGILESLWNGQTIGKRIMHLRVVSADGRPIDGMQAVLRNLLRYLDLMPFVSATGLDTGICPTFAVGLVAAALSRRFQRLGDVVAGTMVVVEPRTTLHGFSTQPPAEVLRIARLLPTTLLADRAEAAAVLAYYERAAHFSTEQRAELAAPLIRKWRSQFSLPASLDVDAVMMAMYFRLFVSDQVEFEVG